MFSEEDINTHENSLNKHFESYFKFEIFLISCKNIDSVIPLCRTGFILPIAGLLRFNLSFFFSIFLLDSNFFFFRRTAYSVKRKDFM